MSFFDLRPPSGNTRTPFTSSDDGNGVAVGAGCPVRVIWEIGDDEAGALDSVLVFFLPVWLFDIDDI